MTLEPLAMPWLDAPLAQLLAQQRGHALILQGRFGDGLLALGWRLARAWLCESGGPRPCGQCGSCHLADQQTHPDLRPVLPETWQLALGLTAGEEGDGEGKASKRKPSKDIRVEQVRQAIDWSHTTSGRGRGKVLLLSPADAMNEVSANALLKTLEEPATGLRLLLCTEDAGQLLPTIRSRCQSWRLPSPEDAPVRAWLSQQGLNDADDLLRACQGQALSAWQAAQQGWRADAWRALPRLVAQGDAQSLSALAPPDALRQLQQLCHDAMAVAVGGEPRYFDRQALPARLRLEALVPWSRALAQAVRQQDHPWNAGLLIESLVLQGQAALAPAAAVSPRRAAAQRPATLRP
ncbi:DNA polymerase III subunit delta' [Ideonella alba]|uniref:DNA polymerase III subunit delta n=1 Tax=Ideonella alba TaxID=2824118 RepID=A0A940YA76_9BURK|nr:DNA polymerase III subunit delta' [Ideonella alba]MBQ0931000.1 DNA polymerase III subunit delta' [Ideonella alba]